MKLFLPLLLLLAGCSSYRMKDAVGPPKTAVAPQIDLDAKNFSEPIKEYLGNVFLGYTCADKTRFLMTSEDGKLHCIKLIEPMEGR